MNGQLLAEKVDALFPLYEKHFSERGGVTPSDPLDYHLFQLARYWSRLVGFCRQERANPEFWIDTDMGACIAVGSKLAHQLIGADSLMRDHWQEYWRQTQAILHERPVTFADVKSASYLFDNVLTALKYDPWGK